MAALKTWAAGDPVTATDINANFSSLGNARLLSLLAGEAITALDPVRIGSYQSDGGIGYDTSVTASSSPMNITVASNSNRLLLLAVYTNSISTTATYNGVAMTVVCQVGTGSNWLYIFKTIAPATGTHALAWTGATTQAAAYSFYNCDQSTSTDGNNGNTGGGVDYGAGGASNSITPTVEGDVLFAAGAYSVSPNTLSASPNNVNLHTNGSTSLVTGHSVVIEGTSTQTVSAGTSGGGGTPTEIAFLLIKPATTLVRAIYRANASDTTHANGFIGFAEGAISKDATGVVLIGGKVTGLTGLTTAAQYYLGNSSGAANLSTSAGTVSRKVGIGLSRTELLITNNW